MIHATLDNAMAIEATKESIGEHIGKGGIWVYPILGFAFLSLAVAAFKAFELMSLPKPKEGFLAEVLAKLANKDKEGAAHVANSSSGPMGKMIQQGVKYSDHNPELVEEILYESMVETQPKVMRLLPFISVTAAVAPLLGLLGTVTGMINTFNRIKIFGTGDAKSLSGGISEALITTAAGLSVAIPSLAPLRDFVPQGERLPSSHGENVHQLHKRHQDHRITWTGLSRKRLSFGWLEGP